ncbi:MAG: hypothetical protein V9G19_00750 [Tetrasphaera sp.]
MIVAVSRARIRLVVLLLLLAVAAPAALAAAKYPRYWLWIAPELTPMTWLQTVVLVLAAAAAGLISFTGSLRGWSGWQRLPYAALGLGLLYLALDDRFAVHERIRDRILAPRNLRIPGLTWLAPGDFQMLLMAVAGLLLLPFVLRALRRDRLAFLLFILGAVTAAVAIGMDSIDPSTMPVETERLEQTAEECLELLAGCLFLASLGARLLGLIGEPAAASRWTKLAVPDHPTAPDHAVPAAPAASGEATVALPQRPRESDGGRELVSVHGTGN